MFMSLLASLLIPKLARVFRSLVLASVLMLRSCLLDECSLLLMERQPMEREVDRKLLARDGHKRSGMSLAGLEGY